MLIAEMLAIHFCSDQNECLVVLELLLDEVERRVRAGVGLSEADAVRVFWLNPVADLRVMNLLEDVGGRICGTEYLFSHALDPIPEDLPPMEALARMALADPMVGSPADRAERVCRDMLAFRAEALVISRIPGASHCAMEGADDRRDRAPSAWRAGGGDRSAAVDRFHGTDVADASGSTGRNSKKRSQSHDLCRY